MKPLALLLLTLTAQNALAFNSLTEQMGSSSATGGAGLLLFACWLITFVGLPIVVFGFISDSLHKYFPKLGDNQNLLLTACIQGSFTYFNADWLFPIVNQLSVIIPLLLIADFFYWLHKTF